MAESPAELITPEAGTPPARQARGAGTTSKERGPLVGDAGLISRSGLARWTGSIPSSPTTSSGCSQEAYGAPLSRERSRVRIPSAAPLHAGSFGRTRPLYGRQTGSIPVSSSTSSRCLLNGEEAAFQADIGGFDPRHRLHSNRARGRHPCQRALRQRGPGPLQCGLGNR